MNGCERVCLMPTININLNYINGKSMNNVVIEINGIRHKLVEARGYSKCCACSLEKLCYEAWEQSKDCSICGSLMINSGYHFELETK